MLLFPLLYDCCSLCTCIAVLFVLCRCKVQRSSTGLEVTSETTKVAVTFDPFQMDFYVNNEIAVVLNSRGLLNFEHYRNKK